MQRSSFLSPQGFEPIQNGAALQIFPSLLHRGPVVQPAGITSSVLYREQKFGPFRHRDASYTVNTWPIGNRNRPRWLNKGREEEKERLGRTREQRKDKFFEEDEGETRRTEKGGGGIDRRRRQARFLTKTDHSLQPQQNLVVCLHRTNNKTHLLAWPYVTSRPHLPRYSMTGLLKTTITTTSPGRLNGEGGEKGGTNGEGHQ